MFIHTIYYCIHNTYGNDITVIQLLSTNTTYLIKKKKKIML